MSSTKWKPGTSGNPLGRPKGTPNKATTLLRESVHKTLCELYPRLAEDIDQLEPKERIDTFIKLLDFALPRLQRTEVKEVTTLDSLFQMTPDERQARIIEIQRELGNEGA